MQTAGNKVEDKHNKTSFTFALIFPPVTLSFMCLLLQIMTNCFGEELYYRQLGIYESAKARCRYQPTYIPGIQPAINTYNIISVRIFLRSPHPSITFRLYPFPSPLLIFVFHDCSSSFFLFN